jgi:hypothetical protein
LSLNTSLTGFHIKDTFHNNPLVNFMKPSLVL